MRAEIISIGTELLLGEIIDTNAAWLAQQLAAIGVDVYFRTTVGDNVGRIASSIQIGLGRADVPRRRSGVDRIEERLLGKAGEVHRAIPLSFR